MKNTATLLSQHKYIPQLDGIRGLAILLVVTFHYLSLLEIHTFGWTGVDLFFVLSGYLISSRLTKTNEEGYFSKFYRNRALRILPVYYITLIFFYVLINVVIQPGNRHFFSYYNDNWWSFLIFFQNWSLMQEVPASNHLQHLWSLAVEEQFYLLWPLFLYLFLGNKYFFKILVFLILAIIFLRTAIYLNYPDPEDRNHFFYNTFCRMDGFIIGGLLYFLQQINPIKNLKIYLWIAFFILMISLLFVGVSTSNPFTSTVGFTIIAIVYAGLIHAVTIHKNFILEKFFSQKWITLTGKISYGWYIYHWLILQLLNGKIIPWLTLNTNLGQTMIICLYLLICFILSYVVSLLSYFYFEIYFLKLKRK